MRACAAAPHRNVDFVAVTDQITLVPKTDRSGALSDLPWLPVHNLGMV